MNSSLSTSFTITSTTTTTSISSSKTNMRQAFGAELTRLARDNHHIQVVVADCRESVGLSDFAREMPQQFTEIGVAEQNLAGVSAGLAMADPYAKIFAVGFASFNPGRNWEQIRISILEQDLPVVIVGSHAGLATGGDGGTHQALEDIALMRALPKMRVMVPADSYQTRQLTQFLAKETNLKPSYLRLPRESGADITQSASPLKFPLGQILEFGHDITLLACGLTVELALSAATQLTSKGISVRVINLPFLYPLDTELIMSAAHETRLLITIEDHQIVGGLGSAVAEYLANWHHRPPQIMIGVDHAFGQTGTKDELWSAYGLTVDHICQVVWENLDKF